MKGTVVSSVDNEASPKKAKTRLQRVTRKVAKRFGIGNTQAVVRPADAALDPLFAFGDGVAVPEEEVKLAKKVKTVLAKFRAGTEAYEKEAERIREMMDLNRQRPSMQRLKECDLDKWVELMVKDIQRKERDDIQRILGTCDLIGEGFSVDSGDYPGNYEVIHASLKGHTRLNGTARGVPQKKTTTRMRRKSRRGRYVTRSKRVRHKRR
jgi:vacuolar-type H+-ATPase subunit I/STV1